MKKTLVLLATIVSLSAMAQNEKAFSIRGSYSNISMPVQKIYLFYRDGDKTVTDSAVPKDNHYLLSGKMAEASVVFLRVKYEPGADGKPVRQVSARDGVSLFLSNDNVEVNSVDSFSNVTVKGSHANDEYVKLNATLKDANDREKLAGADYTKAAQAKDEPARKAAEAKIDAIEREVATLHGEYVKNNPQSPIALYALSRFAGWDIDVPVVEPLYNKLPAAARESASGKQLASLIATAKKTSVGQMAMDFTQNDTLGHPVSLSSLRGKYVLVDFWASWCGPCRRENPNVVLAYNQYKDKGFNIIGVSLDRPDAKDKWMEAIHKDNLTWTHVSDLKYWQNDVAKLYGVQAIPQNYLLDPSGKIIAKNLNGEQLSQKLAEVLP